MSLVTGLNLQERFPFEDLTGDNADMLALLLANADLRAGGHNNAEMNSVIYRVGHPAINRAAESVDVLEGNRGVALDSGVITYEAIAGLVRPRTEEGRSVLLVGAHAARLARLGGDDFITRLDEAGERFRDTHPHTAAVVAEVADRFTPEAVDYAVYGAALACQFELKTV